MCDEHSNPMRHDLVMQYISAKYLQKEEPETSFSCKKQTKYRGIKERKYALVQEKKIRFKKKRYRPRKKEEHTHSSKKVRFKNNVMIKKKE